MSKKYIFVKNGRKLPDKLLLAIRKTEYAIKSVSQRINEDRKSIDFRRPGQEHTEQAFNLRVAARKELKEALACLVSAQSNLIDAEDEESEAFKAFE